MSSAADALEERIRERAYYIWEASGRPLGRDEEFWLRACEVIATDRAPGTGAVRSAKRPPATAKRNRAKR